MSLANYAANIAEDDTFEAQHDELRSALDAKVIKVFKISRKSLLLTN